MLLYLDICALKRPFDDQYQERVAAETHAVLIIMNRVENGVDRAIWSTALTLENNADPDAESRSEIARFASRAELSLTISPKIQARLLSLVSGGMHPLDAAHMAFAESTRCDALITCDDRLIRLAKQLKCLIRVVNPIEYVKEVGHG